MIFIIECIFIIIRYIFHYNKNARRRIELQSRYDYLVNDNGAIARYYFPEKICGST